VASRDIRPAAHQPGTVLRCPAKHRRKLRRWSRSPQYLRWIDLNLRHALSENSVEMRWRVFVELELDFHAIDNCECRYRENFPAY
jgi:hypothetical protein